MQIEAYLSKTLMIPNLTSIIIILLGATPVLILIMFLPAILEIKKPRDGGPRVIMNSIPQVKMPMIHAIPVVNIEEEQKFEMSLFQRIGNIIEVLPNLEI